MRCPFCGAQETKVVDSRLATDGDQVRRRRKCGACQARFTTYESAVLTMPRVIKSDNARVAFDGRKLRSGIMKALEKRPIATDKIEMALTRINRELIAKAESEVESRFIGQLVMNELRILDPVAYIRFVSVYRDFSKLSEFKAEINKLEKRNQAK